MLLTLQDKIKDAGAVVPRLTQGTIKYGLDHIVYNHWWSSGIADKSRFAIDIGLRQLKALIDAAAGPITRVEGNSYVLERNVGRIIGTDAVGNPTSWLRVITTQAGEVITAYPIPMP